MVLFGETKGNCLSSNDDHLHSGSNIRPRLCVVNIEYYECMKSIQVREWTEDLCVELRYT